VSPVSQRSSFLADAAVSGAVAALTTTAAITLLGHQRDGSAWAPLNAVSHILWGDEAATHTEKSLTYTGSGAALNTGAMLSWGAVYAAFLALMPRRTPTAAVGVAVATTALAYVTDYHVVPRRLTPGFEKRLSGGEMAVIYGALAIGLAAGWGLLRRQSAT